MKVLRKRYNREVRESYASDFLPGLNYRSKREMWTTWAMYTLSALLLAAVALFNLTFNSLKSELVFLAVIVGVMIFLSLGWFTWVVWGRTAFPLNNKPQDYRQQSAIMALIARYGRELQKSRTSGYRPGLPYRSKREKWTLVVMAGGILYVTLRFLWNSHLPFIVILAASFGIMIFYFLGWFAWVVWGRTAFPLKYEQRPHDRQQTMSST